MLFVKNAEMSRVFRRFPGSRLRPQRPHPKRLCQPLFRNGAPNAKNHRKISHLCRQHPFLRVYFYINLPSRLLSPWAQGSSSEADYAPLARRITRETGLRYVHEMAEAAEVGDRPFLGALRARLKAWSMGRRDSVIGDTPAGCDPV
jgi:hypothetical protein